MGISSLINVPKNMREWEAWSFNHKIQHDAIASAILAQKTKSLIPYILDPINRTDPQVFLQNNSQTHIDICNILDVAGSDLSSVDWEDPQQLENWIYLHWQEHSTFNTTLKI